MESTVLLLIAAILVMLGRVPIGNYISQYIPAIADWIMAVPNLAAKRGILLGCEFGRQLRLSSNHIRYRTGLIGRR